MYNADDALDTAVAFLKSLADHAVGEEKEHTKRVRTNASAWVRHLAVGAAHPDSGEQTPRDFAGARRFVARTLRDGDAVQQRTEQQCRDTAYGFASELHALVAGEADDEGALQLGIDTLRLATEEASLDELRVVTSKVARQLFAVVAERKQRRSEASARMAARLPDLLDVLQRASGASVDPVTGFLDKAGLLEAAERAYLLGSLAEAPVTVSVFELRDPRLRRDTTDALMASVAGSLSRAFLSRNDILGRESDNSFAVISVGADVARARQASVKARDAVSLVARARAAELGFENLEVVVGFAPLSAPVSSSFRMARQL